MKVNNNNKHVFGTKEWAAHNRNFINGCSNDCKYCFAKSIAVRFKRKTPENWHEEVINHVNLNKSYKKTDGTIMFPSSHDITPINLEYSISLLRKLLIVGNKVLIVSKPHFLVVQALCNEFSEYKNNILFRFTIGSMNAEILKFWEPNAPSYEERKKCLIYAYNNGFQTSLSCEPFLDDNIVTLVEDLELYVTDAIWIGKVNNLKQILSVNGSADNETLSKANELHLLQSDSNIRGLYKQLSGNKKVKWKESIKKVVGLEISTVKGSDK